MKEISRYKLVNLLYFLFIINIDCVLFSTFATQFIQNPTIDMQEKIIILDFGSQTTQLIGRRVRELDTYCEIVPYNKFPKEDPTIKGVILSGKSLFRFRIKMLSK